MKVKKSILCIFSFFPELARRLLEGAESFDTRVWVVAVVVVMGTLVMLAIGTCYLLYKECRTPSCKLSILVLGLFYFKSCKDGRRPGVEFGKVLKHYSKCHVGQ